MIEYIILVVIILIGVLYFEKLPENKSKRWYIFELICIVLLFGLRYKVGGDSIHYESTYLDYPTLDKYLFYDQNFPDRYAPLWRLFVSICRTISQEFWVLQTIHALLFNSCIFYFFKRYTTRPHFAVLLYTICYIFIYNTETLRASLAIAVFLLSYESLIKKNWGKYVIYCAISYLFHYEAIIMVFFPVISIFANKQMKIKNITLAICISYFFITVIDLYPLLQLMSSYNENLSNYYDYYSYASGSIYNVNAIIFDAITKVLPVVLLLLLTKQSGVEKTFVLMTSCFLVLSIRYSVFVSRMIYFMAPILILYICKLTESGNLLLLRGRSYCALCILGFIISTIYMHLYILPFVYPYSSVLYPVDYPQREYLFELLMSR